MSNRIMHILLAEDDELDAATTKRYLSREDFDFDLSIVRDGTQALEFLYHSGDYQDVRSPDLIILDMNMPAMTGGHVIHAIKKDSNLSHIPIILLTGEDLSEDKIKEYGLPRECYIPKWVDMERFHAAIKKVQQFQTIILDKRDQKTIQSEEIKLSVQNLRDHKKYIDKILESMLDSLIILDPNVIIRSANQATLSLLKYDEKDLVGQHLGLICKDWRGLSDQEASFSLMGTSVIGNSPKTYLKKDGNEVPVSFSSSIMLNEDGKPEGYVCVAQDRTQQKKIEEEIIKKTEQLEESNRELEQFAYVASHDLREPLRKITSFGDLLKKNLIQDDSEKSMAYVGKMQNAAYRMQEMIESLLKLSRIGHHNEPFQLVSLNSLIQEVLSDLENQIDRAGAMITTTDMPKISGHPLQLRQLFQNIISNGIKYHKKDTPPIVEISHREKPKSVEIKIQDNGIGMDPSNIQSIFEPFRRLNTKDKFEGSGIGLSICKKVVDCHKGKIHVESKPNEGSVFKIEIPTNLAF